MRVNWTMAVVVAKLLNPLSVAVKVTIKSGLYTSVVAGVAKASDVTARPRVWLKGVLVTGLVRAAK